MEQVILDHLIFDHQLASGQKLNRSNDHTHFDFRQVENQKLYRSNDHSLSATNIISLFGIYPNFVIDEEQYRINDYDVKRLFIFSNTLSYVQKESDNFWKNKKEYYTVRNYVPQSYYVRIRNNDSIEVWSKVNGVDNGPYQYFREGGVCKKGNFINGEMKGLWIIYDMNGKILDQEEY